MMASPESNDLLGRGSAKRKDLTHEDDDLDALESLTSSTSSHPASCKRRHVPQQGCTYQDAAVKELRTLFGSRADDATIDSVYFEQADEDMYKSIARLVAATGLHSELVQETHAQEELKDDSPVHGSTKAAFVSHRRTHPALCPLPALYCRAST